MIVNMNHVIEATVWAVNNRRYLARKLGVSEQRSACDTCGLSVPTGEMWKVTETIYRGTSVYVLGKPMRIPGTMIDTNDLGVVCSETCLEEIVRKFAQPLLNTIIGKQRTLYKEWMKGMPENGIPEKSMLAAINGFATFLAETDPERLHTLRQFQYAEAREKRKAAQLAKRSALQEPTQPEEPERLDVKPSVISGVKNTTTVHTTLNVNDDKFIAEFVRAFYPFMNITVRKVEKRLRLGPRTALGEQCTRAMNTALREGSVTLTDFQENTLTLRRVRYAQPKAETQA